MKVFIAGATGVLGRRVSRALALKGHEVSALSRSEANDAQISEAGGRAVRGDLFDPADVARAAAGAEVVLHLATAIPPKSRPTAGDWAVNDRIRTEGSANLLAAAHEVGAKKYVQQSVLFLYGDRKGEWVDESSPLSEDVPRMLQSARSMESVAKGFSDEKGLATMTLRFGMFYAHDAGATRGMFAAAQAGKLPVIGAGDNYWNPMNVDDAAGAVVQAVERANTAGSITLNVCDDGPVTSRELTEFICEQLGSRTPRSVPGFLAKLALGADTYRVMKASVRCSNAKAKDVLGWKPSFGSPMEGYAEVIRKWRANEGKKA